VVAVLGYNALQTALAGMGEDGRTVALEVLSELDPERRFVEQLFEPGLAGIERPGAPVLAVELQKVEGIEEGLPIIRPAMQLLEHGYAGLIATDCLTIDRRGCRRQRRHGRVDARIALSPIEVAAGEQTHPAPPLAGDQAVAIVFDLVNPLRSDRRLGSGCTVR
jgi:hypothetical protein